MRCTEVFSSTQEQDVGEVLPAQPFDSNEPKLHKVLQSAGAVHPLERKGSAAQLDDGVAFENRVRAKGTLRVTSCHHLRNDVLAVTSPMAKLVAVVALACAASHILV